MHEGYGDIAERCRAVADRLEASGARADADDVRELVRERDEARELIELLGIGEPALLLPPLRELRRGLDLPQPQAGKG